MPGRVVRRRRGAGWEPTGVAALPPPAGEIIKEMGWVALFTRGLPLRIVMIGTLTGLQWGIYDAYKVYVGL